MRADLTPPEFVATLAQRCANAGGRAMLVGGSVRDHLMDRGIKDWDLEVFGIEPADLERLLRQLGPVNTVGRSFAVFKLRKGEIELDVSIPRRDHKVGPGHRGIAVTGDPHMSFSEAARRRDLSINSMMVDLHTGELVDLYGGVDDLRKKVLREVDATTFLEDPLRALRVVQFAARLKFKVAPQLLTLCQNASLDELPAERIFGEWQKLMLISRVPSIGLQFARDAHILQRIFPEVSGRDHVQVDRIVDDLAARHRHQLEPDGRRWALMAAGWLHDLHEKAVIATLDRLGLHRLGRYRTREATVAAISHLNHPIDTDTDLRRLSTLAEPELVLRLVAVIRQLPVAMERHQRAVELGVVREPLEPLLKGRHLNQLGVSPGPGMGELLREAYDRQLDGTVNTTEEAIKWAEQMLTDQQE